MTQMTQTPRPKVAIVGGDFIVHPETSDIPLKYWNRLNEIAEIVVIPQTTYDEALPLYKEAVKASGGFEAVIYAFDWSKPIPVPLDERILSIFTSSGTKLFSAGGAGYDRVDVSFLTSVGATYANNPNTVGYRTADSCAMMIMMAMRGITEQEAILRRGGFADRGLKSVQARGRTLGIIGMGAIGQQVAAHMSYFGMNIVYNNRSRLPPGKEKSYEYVSREELYARSDVISLNCPLTPETTGLISAKEIAQMKDGVILVNTARGTVCDEDAVLDGLDSRKILRFAADVHTNEPHLSKRLLEAKHTILTPHCAVLDDRLRAESQLELLENLEAFIVTGKANTPVN